MLSPNPGQVLCGTRQANSAGIPGIPPQPSHVCRSPAVLFARMVGHAQAFPPAPSAWCICPGCIFLPGRPGGWSRLLRGPSWHSRAMLPGPRQEMLLNLLAEGAARTRSLSRSGSSKMTVATVLVLKSGILREKSPCHQCKIDGGGKDHVALCARRCFSHQGCRRRNPPSRGSRSGAASRVCLFESYFL